MSGSTHTPAESPETRLLSAFKTDGHARKVYLAGRGESAPLRSFINQETSAQERTGRLSCSYLHYEFNLIMTNTSSVRLQRTQSLSAGLQHL